MPQDRGCLPRLLTPASRGRLPWAPRSLRPLICLKTENHASSSAGEFHPRALTEPDVRLSPHPALTTQPLLLAVDAKGIVEVAAVMGLSAIWRSLTSHGLVPAAGPVRRWLAVWIWVA
jgi:hypothetical protein